MFAARISDGAQVVIKRVWSLESGVDEELKTMILVSSEGLRDDTMNHCIQLLAWFPLEDDVEPELSDYRFAFAVMPLLRDWRLPSFRLAVESLEFISQLLEVGPHVCVDPSSLTHKFMGLVFMHKNNITLGLAAFSVFSIFPSTLNSILAIYGLTILAWTRLRCSFLV